MIKLEEKISRIHNDEWKDVELKNASCKVIKQGMKQNEILSYMNRDFHIYAWRERTLLTEHCRRQPMLLKMKFKDQENCLDIVQCIKAEASKFLLFCMFLILGKVRLDRNIGLSSFSLLGPCAAQ